MKFEVTESDQKKIKDWLENTVYPLAISKQREQIQNPNWIYQQCWEDGYPYEGAIGGGLQYIFTPNGIGECFKVRYSSVDLELDLTDYESW